MKLHRMLGLGLAILLCAVVSAFGQGLQGGGHWRCARGCSRRHPEHARPQGVRVTNDQGATLCESLAAQDSSHQRQPQRPHRTCFWALPDGSLRGRVCTSPMPATDFRSQNIKAGFYTLRYALIPQDGNHMGVNPTRDAFVLAPVAADSDPDKILSFDDLVKLSTQASGTPHPGFLVGAAVNGSTFPSVAKDDSGNWDVQIKGHTSSGDLPVAITVVGHWQG